MRESILGIDVGAVSLSAALVAPDGRLLRGTSRPHGGEVETCLHTCLDALQAGGSMRVVTRSTPRSIAAAHRADNLVAAIRAAQALHPGLGALLLVGGERFSLSLFDSEGSYRESRFNSLCAAGTGSFLDQQARRLGLADSAAIGETALRADGERPRIATRCAVFAKTDLIHAQQEGFSLEAICDGLCHGLAANVLDALVSGRPLPDPVVFAGGVAHNPAVVAHMRSILDRPLTVDAQASLYGAYGAVLDYLEVGRSRGRPAGRSGPRLAAAACDSAPSRSFFPPLQPTSGAYPDFAAGDGWLFRPRVVQSAQPVEVDAYHTPTGRHSLSALLGLDIGSTSTKALLLDADRDAAAAGTAAPQVLAGFYTRTAGRPLVAVQAIFEAAADWAERAGLSLEVAAAATTGSGRKFIGALIGADEVLDEITAHARAAVELDPEVDTIIEIGGQDAKFTTLRDGAVTQSFMNHVCAAGTGSFIEEQAQRLGCSLRAFAERTAGRRAPLASDRCTVFMERDINHFLADGVAVDEVLCAVLHAVRDNYLLKVARQGSIGDRICFQGATAKNRSLVAAFEQKLGKAIHVSRYCHLTGALGAALELSDARLREPRSSDFKGLDLFRERIPVCTEICDLCRNHCKLRLAEVRGQRVGYGYLCGRDPDEERFVSSNRSGFDLLRARARHFRVDTPRPRRDVVIGLPAALHLFEELPLWRRFFAELGVRCVSSERLTDPVTRGKRLAGAEFCAPVAAWHAHVASLADRADWIFTPNYLEREHPRDERRLYCYYTQYAPSMVADMQLPGLADKCLMPLVHIGERRFAGGGRLHAALQPALGPDLSRSEVERAYDKASEWFAARRTSWARVLEQEREGDELSVVLLGRPYTVLSPKMNKSIPELLARMGIKTFDQDVLAETALERNADLAPKLRWAQGQRLMAAAEAVARIPGLYPVLITSFKCTPDGCLLETFRRLMNASGKPYLVLQLDEHDSRVGYETRLEAAVRAFRNHHAGARPSGGRSRLPVLPERGRSLGDRHLLIPAWDTLASPLFVAGLQQAGIDARLIHEDGDLIQESLGLNTGQCIPLNIIVHEFAAQVEREGLDPARTALWMPSSSIPCNICFFPEYAKGLLESMGGGLERCRVYAGDISAADISPRAMLNAFFAFLFGGMLRRMQCKRRAHELRAGQTDRAVTAGLEIFTEALLGRRPKLEAARKVVEHFLAVEVDGRPRQQVAIFGDLYVRDNDVVNQDLLRTIEAHGGEVVTTPYTEYVNIIALPYLRKWLREGSYADVLKSAPFALSLELLERPFRREFARVLGEHPRMADLGNRKEILDQFKLSLYHTGESFDNLLKIFHLLERYPDISLFVQTNPAFCCPSLVTEAMAARIEQATGVPVVSITYDGTAAPKNDMVVPYLELGRAPAGASPQRRAGTGSDSI